jgi:hypothetical protein
VWVIGYNGKATDIATSEKMNMIVTIRMSDCIGVWLFVENGLIDWERGGEKLYLYHCNGTKEGTLRHRASGIKEGSPRHLACGILP